MADDRRRIAADARRATTKDAAEQTAEIRRLLAGQFERGRERGRAEIAAEVSVVDARSALLDAGADFLSLLAGRTSAIPNSNRALSAYREAEAMLRDAQRVGEPPDDPKKGQAKKAKAAA